MKKLILSLFIGISALLCQSCFDTDDDFDNRYTSGWEEFEKLDKDKFYLTSAGPYSNFEELLYHDGKYIAAKYDEENRVFVYFLGRTDISDYYGIFIVINEDGTLNCFGHQDNIISTLISEDGDISFVGIDPITRDIRIIETDGKIETLSRADGQMEGGGYNVWSWVKVGLGFLPGLGEAIDIYDFNESWKKQEGVGATLAAFSLGVSIAAPEFSIVPNSLSVFYNEWEQECAELLKKLYGNCCPEITDIKSLGDDKYEITVNIQNIENVREYWTVNIENFFGCRQENIKREVYVGLILGEGINCSLDHKIDHAYEQDVVLGDKANPEFKFIMTVPGKNLYYVRPYLNSDLRFNGDRRFRMFGKHILYGDPEALVNAPFDYDYQQINAIANTYYDHLENVYIRSIDFQYVVRSDVNFAIFVATNDVYVLDYGIEVFDSNGNTVDGISFLQGRANNNKNGNNYEITCNLEVSNRFDKVSFTPGFQIDENGFVAKTNGWTIKSYILVNVLDKWQHTEKRIYGQEREFVLRYDEDPSIRYTDCEYKWTHIFDGTIWGWGQPFLIGDENDNIYGDAMSSCNVNCEITGAFFIKSRKYEAVGSGWTKYVELLVPNEPQLDTYDGYTTCVTPGGIAWNRQHNSCTQSLHHLQRLETFGGRTISSNMVIFDPIYHTDESGGYYFGYQPRIQ